MAKILILDIENAPALAYVWDCWNTNVGASQLLSHKHIMSFAARWLGDNKTYYEDSRTKDDKNIVTSLVEFLSEADIVVAHNADRHDLPMINGRALVHGIRPPSPYHVVDTLKVARRQFKFPLNSLEYLAKALGCTPKQAHKKFPGFELWLECIKGNEQAWGEMRDYNIQDVLTLEEVYLKMRPWISNHPNVGVFSGLDTPVCPKCNGTNLHFRGYAYTSVSKFHRFQCQDCGGWGRTRYNEMAQDKRKVLVTNAVVQ